MQHRTLPRFILAMLLACAGQAPCAAATVWGGPEVRFLKLGSDPASVQDVLSATVSLTRGLTGHLFNPLGGDS
ncbi:MAG: hypothetical protein RLW62_14460, partial [Gammaproteobacteria bacterium]